MHTKGGIMKHVIVVIGAGQIGQAIARRVGIGKHVLLADVRAENAAAASDVLSNAGYEVSTATVDVSSREAVHALAEQAASTGDVTGLIHGAGVSPSQASPATVLKVDLYGTALVLEEFGAVIARGGTGVVISSQSGHRLPALTVEQNRALATTPTEELLALPFVQLDQIRDSLHAYQLSKRGNSLRVMAESVRWGRRGARINTISPGIVMTPLAKDELSGPRGEGYRRMIEGSVAKRAGTPDEVAAVGALLMGPEGGFITGSDFLMDGGVTAAYWYGDVAEVRQPAEGAN
jgi:NAD(P)-dependent dehydrogenase (short-subunit alcohol dehydrogenase family)